jgi:hypothetical protein
MITYIADIIPRLQQFSQKLDNQTLLVNQHWVAVDNIGNVKTIYIFRSNSELLISTNGRVEKARWEYIGNRSLLIDRKDESYLFKHGFFDENVLALKVDSKEEYAFLVNENKFDGEVNSVERVLDFLQTKYLLSESPIRLSNENDELIQGTEGGIVISPNSISQSEPRGETLVWIFIVVAVLGLAMVFVVVLG